MMRNLGLVHLYTGDGKGKTTAAVGLAARALGSGFKVLYVSFHKCPEQFGYTEMESLKKLGATVINYAQGHPHLDSSIDSVGLADEVRLALQELNDRLAAEPFDLLIMDEILISIRDSYLSEDALVEFVRNKPSEMELVLTGRGATERLIELSDYVSVVGNLKHPYERNIQSRKGIEF